MDYNQQMYQQQGYPGAGGYQQSYNQPPPSYPHPPAPQNYSPAPPPLHSAYQSPLPPAPPAAVPLPQYMDDIDDLHQEDTYNTNSYTAAPGYWDAPTQIRNQEYYDPPPPVTASYSAPAPAYDDFAPPAPIVIEQHYDDRKVVARSYEKNDSEPVVPITLNLESAKPVPPCPPEQSKHIGIFNLPKSFKEDDLYDYISKFGTIENLNIIKDKSTGNNKGYAFAEMSSPEEAWMLKQKGTGSEFGGQLLRVADAHRKSDELHKPNPFKTEPPRKTLQNFVPSDPVDNFKAPALPDMSKLPPTYLGRIMTNPQFLAMQSIVSKVVAERKAGR